MLFNEISLDGAALRDLNALVATPAGDLGSTLAVLDVALSEAEPDRASLQLLAVNFPGWLAAASNPARPQFLEILPNIAAHLKELGRSGVESLIAGFNACASAEDRDLLARSIVRYQETSGEIIRRCGEDRQPAAAQRFRPGCGADADGCAAGGDVRLQGRPGAASGHRQAKDRRRP